jgi:hypothetical protein
MSSLVEREKSLLLEMKRKKYQSASVHYLFRNLEEYVIWVALASWVQFCRFCYTIQCSYFQDSFNWEVVMRFPALRQRPILKAISRVVVRLVMPIRLLEMM